MKIEVNIQKKFAFAIIGLLVVLIVGGFVYASHTTDTSVNHGINQITGIPTCSATQVLSHRGAAGVECVLDATTAGSTAGRVVGGGGHIPGAGGGGCQNTGAVGNPIGAVWGTGSCSGGFFTCNASTQKFVGTWNTHHVFVCLS